MSNFDPSWFETGCVVPGAESGAGKTAGAAKSVDLPADGFTGSGYVHFDSSPLLVKVGVHGLGARFDHTDFTLQADLYGRRVKRGETVAPMPVSSPRAAARKTVKGAGLNTFDRPAVVEFICWGKSHRYYARDYADVAVHWRDNLFQEARITARSIQGDQAIAREFMQGNGSFGAWMTQMIDAAKRTIHQKKLPSPDAYGALEDLTWKLHRRLKASSANDYRLIHHVGMQLARIRYKQDWLTRAMQEGIHGLIDAAKDGEAVARKVEGAAFSLLELYGQVRYAKQPAQYAAYRCGVLAMRAGARYLGESLAENSTRQALRNTGEIICRDFPPIVKDLVLGYLKRGLGRQGLSAGLEDVVEEFIEFQVWLAFRAADFYGFEVEAMPATEQDRANEIFRDLVVKEAVDRIVTGIINAVLGKVRAAANRDGVPLWIAKLADVLPAVLQIIIHEVGKIRKIAAEEQRPFFEVFCAELGPALLRILKDVATDIGRARIRDAMTRKQARDRKYWAEILLGKGKVINDIGSPPPGARTARTGLAWDEKAPPTSDGPTATGDLGVIKFVPLAGAANPKDSTSASKPPRKVRAGVLMADAQDVRTVKNPSPEWNEHIEKTELALEDSGSHAPPLHGGKLAAAEQERRALTGEVPQAEKDRRARRGVKSNGKKDKLPEHATNFTGSDKLPNENLVVAHDRAENSALLERAKAWADFPVSDEGSLYKGGPRLSDEELNKLKNERQYLAFELPLERVYGSNWQARVTGRTKTGPNTTKETDFSEGGDTVHYYQRKKKEEWSNITVFPKPRELYREADTGD